MFFDSAALFSAGGVCAIDIMGSANPARIATKIPALPAGCGSKFISRLQK